MTFSATINQTNVCYRINRNCFVRCCWFLCCCVVVVLLAMYEMCVWVVGGGWWVVGGGWWVVGGEEK